MQFTHIRMFRTGITYITFNYLIEKAWYTYLPHMNIIIMCKSRSEMFIGLVKVLLFPKPLCHSVLCRIPSVHKNLKYNWIVTDIKKQLLMYEFYIRKIWILNSSCFRINRCNHICPRNTLLLITAQKWRVCMKWCALSATTTNHQIKYNKLNLINS